MRIFAIGCTNMVVCICLTTISIMSMLGQQTTDIEVVTSLLLFPINAILNPLFNTILSEGFYNVLTSAVGAPVLCALNCVYISVHNRMSALKLQLFKL